MYSPLLHQGDGRNLTYLKTQMNCMARKYFPVSDGIGAL